MFLPVERSITVSAPQRMDQIIFSTSSSMEEATAELPMLELIFTRKLRPMIIGSLSGWLILAGMIARPRATSSRTNSGVIRSGMLRAPRLARMLRDAAAMCRSAMPVRALQFAGLILADGNEFHFRCDDALRGVMQLGDIHAGLWLAEVCECDGTEVRSSFGSAARRRPY